MPDTEDQPRMVDIYGPVEVDVTIDLDGKRVWVNAYIEGQAPRCLFRAQAIRRLSVDDRRYGRLPTEADGIDSLPPNPIPDNFWERYPRTQTFLVGAGYEFSHPRYDSIPCSKVASCCDALFYFATDDKGSLEFIFEIAGDGVVDMLDDPDARDDEKCLAAVITWAQRDDYKNAIAER